MSAPSNWQKSLFCANKVRCSSGGFRVVVKVFRRSNCLGTKFGGVFPFPPNPPKEQLLGRYWFHVVNCRSCSAAYDGLNALEVALQIISIASIGIVAETKQGMISATLRNTLLAMAVLCFASNLLSHFIYKNFHFHDYNHAFR